MRAEQGGAEQEVLEADDFYEHIEESLEDDEITSEEEGFMTGFINA